MSLPFPTAFTCWEPPPSTHCSVDSTDLHSSPGLCSPSTQRVTCECQLLAQCRSPGSVQPTMTDGMNGSPASIPVATRDRCSGRLASTALRCSCLRLPPFMCTAGRFHQPLRDWARCPCPMFCSPWPCTGRNGGSHWRLAEEREWLDGPSWDWQSCSETQVRPS